MSGIFLIFAPGFKICLTMNTFDFTAIDFETMTAEHTSACAIGIARVENCVITQKFYSLIKPIPDSRETNNTHVHGISPDMVDNAPTWAELWPVIEKYFTGKVVVCHNADFDTDVLKRVCDHYGIHLSVEKVIDTMMITHQGLKDSCAVAGIPLENHHDALCDATACARIMLTCMGIKYEPHIYEKITIADKQQRKVSSETKKPLEASEVENKETPFFQKKVVLTGVLDAFPVREEIANTLKNYGADINGSISAKTNIVIVGHGAGPSKMRKIEELITSGYDIKVIYEPEFLEIIEKYGIK